MKIDGALPAADLAAPGAVASTPDAQAFDGVLSFESGRVLTDRGGRWPLTPTA